MNIRKSPKKDNELIFEVFQEEYKYWDTFCDYFIDKCAKVLESKEHPERTRRQFQNAKESLELILFTLDVGQEDKMTRTTAPSTFLILYLSLMKKWDGMIAIELQQNLVKLQKATNGENKRQFSNEVRLLTYLLDTNRQIVKQIEAFKEAA